MTTVSGNGFGSVGGNVVNAVNGTSFTSGSTGNSGPVGGARCGGDGTAPGQVVFTDGNNCYP